MFKNIGSLAIYVTDLERSKKFYTEVLGFKIRADLGPTLCFLASESGHIDIYLEGGYSPSSIDDKTSRLGFFLRSEQSATDTFNALKAAGVTILQPAPEPVGDNTCVFQFLDPDGNVIDVAGG